MPVFAFILAVIALLPHFANWPAAFVLFLFFLGDWVLLASLPKVGKSFGPDRPPTLILAIMRAVIAILPLSIMLPIQAVGTLLVIYSFWIEPHRIHLTRQTIVTSKLSASASLKILHLGDLHVERITERERQLNRLVADLKPDLILFSGDFINLSYLFDPVSWQNARDVMREWTAPLGVYVVTGSPAVDRPEIMPNVLDGLPVRWLNNEKVMLDVAGQKVAVIGVSCTHVPYKDAPQVVALQNGRVADFSILLYHSPDLAPDAAEAGIDLQLSGHTHGGQVRLPGFGAIFTGSLYGKQLEAGRKQIGDMVLYVSRGIGLEGAAAPRVRFLCPPEVILWEITGSRET